MFILASGCHRRRLRRKNLSGNVVMDPIGAIENASLALQVQATLQRKQLDYQAQNFMVLLEGVKELSEKVNGGRNDSLGKMVDLSA